MVADAQVRRARYRRGDLNSRAAEGIPLSQGENEEYAVGWPRTSPRLPNSSRSFDEGLSASSRSGFSLICETKGGKQDRQ